MAVLHLPATSATLAELAYFGGEVLHPSAMRPCMENKIAILVRNILNPAFAGTVISSDDEPLVIGGNGVTAGTTPSGFDKAPRKSAVKMVTTIESIASVNIKAGSWKSVAAVGKRAMQALEDAGVKVVLITQASSSHSLTVAIDEAAAAAAVAALEEAFELEMIRGDISGINVTGGLSALSIVGPMRGVVGTLAKLTNGFASVQSNVFAVAQGSSERSITALVARDSLATSIKAVHHAFLEQ